MLFCPCAPLLAHVSCFSACRPSSQHASCFQPRAAPRPHLARAIKNPTARLAVGDKVKDSAVPPRLTRHRCRVHSSTANTVRLLTRALRPRLLVTFRLGPPGPILSGSVPAGITPSPTLSQSVSRFLPVNGLLSCFYAITAFSPCQRILTRFFKFSARAAPQRAPSAHPCAHRLMRAMYIVVPRRPSNFPRTFRAQMPSAPRGGSVSARGLTHHSRATHLTRETAAGAENTCAKPQADQHDLVRSTKSCPTAYGMFCIE